jgi:uncharacterized membrane protein YraQ (UPF0718 family)
MLLKPIILLIIIAGLIYLSNYFYSKNQAIENSIMNVEFSYMNNGENGNLNLSQSEFENRKKERNLLVQSLEAKKYPLWISYISTVLLLIAGYLFVPTITSFRKYIVQRQKA